MATRVESEDRTLMFYQFTSKNAFSINLIFVKFILAPNASLLIYNTDRSMVYGPIDKGNNPDNGVFWSDLVKGESIILQLTIIGEDTKETQIHIDKVIHGYRNTFAGFGQSADCNRDIACPEGNDWRNEGNAVAMLLLDDGSRFCTGSLLNNVCQDLTPNFLTAFHCLDLNQNGALADAERNQVNNWVFRFLYESPSCGGGDDAVFQSINGSIFRAAFQPTDFALLLLNNRPTGDVTYAGWSRANVAATSAVAIHHPAGDVKKISIDNNPLTNIGVTTTWVRDGFGNPLVQSPPNTHWNTVFDSPAVGIDPSTVQPGSSGSPIFNQNHQVVGQLHGDYLNTNNDYCDNRRGQYGRFDVSWAGGGTNATRLSNWLDPNNTGAMTTNTVDIPSITGPDLLCSSGTYTLQNLPAGSTATWSVTPSGQFTGSTSGSGTTATLTPSSTAAAQATLTYTITTACGNTQVQRAFWVGKPAIPGNPTVLVNVPPNRFTVSLTPPVNQEVISYNWYVDGILQSGEHNATIRIPWKYPLCGNSYQVKVEAINACGTSAQRTVTLFDPPCFTGYRLRISPNPATSEVEIAVLGSPTVSGDNKSVQQEQLIEEEVGEFVLYDRLGNQLYRQLLEGGRASMDVSKLKPGTYVVKYHSPEGILEGKLLKP